MCTLTFFSLSLSIGKGSEWYVVYLATMILTVGKQSLFILL